MLFVFVFGLGAGKKFQNLLNPHSARTPTHTPAHIHTPHACACAPVHKGWGFMALFVVIAALVVLAGAAAAVLLVIKRRQSRSEVCVCARACVCMRKSWSPELLYKPCQLSLNSHLLEHLLSLTRTSRRLASYPTPAFQNTFLSTDISIFTHFLFPGPESIVCAAPVTSPRHQRLRWLWFAGCLCRMMVRRQQRSEVVDHSNGASRTSIVLFSHILSKRTYRLSFIVCTGERDLDSVILSNIKCCSSRVYIQLNINYHLPTKMYQN